MYAEAQEIADHIKNRRAVVVNLQRIQHDQAKRIVDFLSGTVYAIGGDIQRIGSDIFLCTPENVDVSGTISELILKKNIRGGKAQMILLYQIFGSTLLNRLFFCAHYLHFYVMGAECKGNCSRPVFASFANLISNHSEGSFLRSR